MSVMGCAVNGYGEMLNSNFGIIGKGLGKVDIYKDQTLIYANVSESEAQEYIANIMHEEIELI